MNDIDQPIANRWPLACLVLGASYLGAYTAARPADFLPDMAVYLSALLWPKTISELARLEIIELPSPPRELMLAAAVPMQVLALMAAFLSLYMPDVWSVPAAWLCLAATAAWHAAGMQRRSHGDTGRPTEAGGEPLKTEIPPPGYWTILSLAVPANVLSLLDVCFRRPGYPAASCAMVFAALLLPLWIAVSSVFDTAARRWYSRGRAKFGDRYDPQWARNALYFLLILFLIIPFSMIGILFALIEMPKWVG